MNSLLKFITCGSVDDGKSTLIGHMLYNAKLLFADQERALELDSKIGSRSGQIDYSLLLDGLMAEREQGITIDVAYRYFTTDNRSFIVADTPGHEEYTRNMAVGASFADLAVILIDASKGVLIQTKRHTRICAMMGIKHIVFAVNKMDLVEYSENTFKQIESDVQALSSEYGFDSICVIPVSASEGDNLNAPSINTRWYKGDNLLHYLENIDVGTDESTDGFVMPVQRVCRPDHTYRGFMGQIEAGCISVGDEITSLPSGEKAHVKSINVAFDNVETAYKGQPVSIQLDREMDISRGCVLYKDADLTVGKMFTAGLLWMDDEKLLPGKNYFLKLGTKMMPATVVNIKYKIDVNEGSRVPAERLFKNEIAVCDIAVSDKIVYDKFTHNRSLGGFILIDRVTNMTSACGTVIHRLRRSDNVVEFKMDVTKERRATMKQQKPKTLWFTGLSGSGKSTLANAIEQTMTLRGLHTMLLDGDNIRLGLNKDLGFKESDRIENIRRIAEVSKLMNDAGLIVLTSFISPYIRDRENAKDIIGEDFVEIYVSTPLEVCAERDVKQLYKKAYAGEIPNFTGVSSPYEPPVNPDIEIDTSKYTLEESVEYIMKKLDELDK